MAGSPLKTHGGEILRLLREGKSQAEIIRHFREQGVTLARSSLSDFVRQQGEGETTTVTLPLNGHALSNDQPDYGRAELMEAMMHLQRSIADEQIEKTVEMIEALQELKTEGDARHAALLAALGNLRMTPPPSGEVKQALDAAILRLDRLAARTAGKRGAPGGD